MTPRKSTRAIPQTTRTLRSGSKPMPTPTPTPPSARQLRQFSRRRRGDPWTPRAKAKIPKPRAPPPTHFTCRICAEEQPVASFIKWFTRSREVRGTGREIPYPCVRHLCRNPRLKNDPVCRACIGASMAAKMDLTGARTLSGGCLEPGCVTNWGLDNILKHLPPTSIETYNLGMLPVWREQTRTITCISTTCNNTSLPDPFAPGYPQISCPHCLLRQCAKCQVPWHTGATCTEHSAARIEKLLTTPEKETLVLMQKVDGKRCPNCFIVIEKDGGCDSMYCAGCRKYFNWQEAGSAAPGEKRAEGEQQGTGGNGGSVVVCEVDALVAAGVQVIAVGA